MSLMIGSEISKTYLQEEDAIKGFRTAVENNQLRLALLVLADVIEAFMEGFEAIMEIPEQSEQEKQSVSAENLQNEPKKNNKKVEPKEEKTKDQQ